MENDSPILVIDDSGAVRQTVKNTLISMGYPNVHTASNGLEALEKCRSHKYSVVFLDWTMPEMDGLQFLKVYRKELKIQDSAVVMITARSDKQDILTAVEAGATAYVAKPVSIETIKKKMKQAAEWLDNRAKAGA